MALNRARDRALNVDHRALSHIPNAQGGDRGDHRRHENAGAHVRRHKSRGNAERFVMLPHWMLKCPAWRTLSPNAKAVLLHLWERHNGTNNGEITYGVYHGQRLQAEEVELDEPRLLDVVLVVLGDDLLVVHEAGNVIPERALR